MQVQSKTELKVLLDALIAALGRYNVINVHLFQNDITPTADTALSALDEADFTGYAQVDDPGWGASFINADGDAQALAANCQFTQTATTVSNTIYGYFVTDTTDAILLWAERFEDPIAMDTALKAIAVIPTYVVGQGAA